MDLLLLTMATAFGCKIGLFIEESTDNYISRNTLAKTIEVMINSVSAKDFEFLTMCSNLIMVVSVIIGLFMPLAAAWTFALIPIQFTRSAISKRYLVCQPGMVAAYATTLTLLISCFQIFWVRLCFGEHASARCYAPHVIVSFITMFVGFSNLISWMTLLVTRRWRSHPNWIDRLGRVLAVFWILGGHFMMILVMSPLYYV
jgi:hypothetical protein